MKIPSFFLQRMALYCEAHGLSADYLWMIVLVLHCIHRGRVVSFSTLACIILTRKLPG
jgi:hypothetical protein